MRRNATGQFLPGTGGRPVGARNKLQADFVDALCKDFREHGEGVIRIVRTERPTEYLKILASILPKELLLSDNGAVEDLTDAELREVLEVVRKIKDSAKPTVTKPAGVMEH